MPEVVLIRWVEHEAAGEGQYYGRRMRLPLEPYPGLGVPWDKDFAPHSIAGVRVNPQGDIICLLDREEWTCGDCDTATWPDLLANMTQGWHPLGEDWGYWTSVPREAAPSLPGAGEPTSGPWALSRTIHSDLGGMLPITGPDGVTIGYVLEDTFRKGRMEADGNLIVQAVNSYRGASLVP